MRLSFTVILGLVATLLANQAQAVTLRYAWKPKTTYRFNVQSKDQVDVSAMGMKIQEQFTTASTFALVIHKVNKAGLAEGQLVIESFKVTNNDGNTVAAIDSLPKDALKSLVEIDAKGGFTFKEVLYLVVDEESGANLLVSGKAGPNSASASATVDGEQVSVYAQFDAKTGQLSGGYKVNKIGKEKKRKKVAVKQEAQKVNLLPTQFLELLRLPEGEVAGGAKFSAPMANFNIDVQVEEATAARAKLRTRVATNVDTSKMPAPPAGEMGEDDADDMPPMMGGAMPPGFGPMPGMGAGAGAGASAGAPSMKIDGNFVTDFGIEAGMLEKLQGTLSTAVEAGPGISMKNRTELTMVLVK